MVVEGLDKDVKSLKTELLKLCWYMRGSVTLEDAFALCMEDRELIANIIKENLETTKKSGLPFF
jgi:hypothetical protein